jgi:LacI family transcriptional regulator
MDQIKKQPTIKDVAKAAGVSIQTVSRVINNRPDVASKTRKRIQRIIKEVDYRPNAIARSLSTQRTYNFGLVTSGLEFIGPSVTLSGIANKSEQLGYGLFLKEVPKFHSGGVRYLLDWLLEKQVDGIIWAVPEIGENRDWVDELINDIRVPVIFLTSAKRKNISTVTFDNYTGAKLATQHLLECGRRNIGHISGPMDWWESQERYKGWRDTLINFGIDPEDRMIADGNWSTKSGKKAFEQLKRSFPEMDAIFIANDQMSLGVLHTAYAEGIKVPNEIAIVGFDGIPESEYYSPSLTTVAQNLEQLGSVAVEQLARMVEESNSERELGDPIYLTMKPELIVRRSSVPVS